METRNIVSSMVQTRSIERVLAPIAAQVSQLIILNENAEKEGGRLPNLVPFAQQVLRATEDLVQVGQKLISQSTDEELCRDMPRACESMKSTGRNVLMAVQRLQAEPHSEEAKDNMVTAAKRLLQATLKVLLVSDGAEVRRIIQAAAIVKDRLRLVQSVESMKALVVSFKAFAESVVMLSNLCDRRQQDLTQPQTKEGIVVAMDTLRKSVPTLSSAMQTYVKYHHNAQAMASRDYVISQVSSAISDLVSLMGSQLQEGSASGDRGAEGDDVDRPKEGPGHFVKKIDRVVQLLSPNYRTSLGAEFHRHLQDVVRHSMAVSSLSREKLREQVVSSCKQILKQRCQLQDQSEGLQDNPDFQQLRSDFNHGCECLAKELLVLEKLAKFAIIGQTVDAFVETVEPLDRMVKAATTTLKEKGPLREKDCIRILQPLEETFHEHTDRMCQLGSFAAASCTETRRATALLDAVGRLEQLDPEVFPACLAVRHDILDRGAVRHLKLIRQEWQSEVLRLVEAVDDLIDANRFLELSESYIEDDLEECRQAQIIADRDLLAEAANNLLGRTKRVIQIAYNQLEACQDPIFRNGLRVHINQLEKAMGLFKNGAQKTLSHFQHKRVHEQLTERGHHLLECLHGVGQAVLGKDHPDILNPLREGLKSGARQTAEDFPDYEKDGSLLPRIPVTNESYLSKPLPASAGMLDSDPAANLTDSMSLLQVSKRSPVGQKRAVTPLKLSYPMAGLVRALFSHDQDPRKVDRLCMETENKGSFLASLATRASECTQDLQLKGRIESQALQLISKTSQLVELAKVSLTGTDSAKTEVNILAENWTSAVADVCSSLQDMIGCWGLPGISLMEESLQGCSEALPKEIDGLNLHAQSVLRVVQATAEASQALRSLTESNVVDEPSTQVQLLQKEASDWMRVTHGLVSAANEVVANVDEPLLEDLIKRRWLGWAVKQLQLISIIDSFPMETSTVAAAVATVAMEGSQDEVTEHVQRLKDFAGNIVQMADSLLSCGDMPSSPDELQEVRQSLDKLTKQLTEAVINCSRHRAGEVSSQQMDRRLQRVALVQREWAAKAQLLATQIDRLVGDMATPLDRLCGAALAVSQASGPSRQELLDEFQTQSDSLCTALSGARRICASALKTSQAGPSKSGMLAAMDGLCRLTPVAVTQARGIADNRPAAREEVVSVKREWAYNAKMVMMGLQNNPQVTSTTVKDVTNALRGHGQFSASGLSLHGSSLDDQSRPLDTSSLSPQQLSLLQTLPRQGTSSAFAPRNHSTPSDRSVRPSHRQAVSPSTPLPQWQASLRASRTQHTSSSSPVGRDESDGRKKSSTGSKNVSLDEDAKSAYRTRPLGMQDFPRTPGLRSATSSPSLHGLRTAGGRDAFNQSTYNKCSTSIAAAAMVLQQETEKWEDDSNSIVKVAKTISAQMYDMAKYSRKISDPAAKEEMINTAKAIAANGKVIYKFAEILAEHCLDRRVGDDLKFCAENIPSLCTQLSIISSVKTATPNDNTTDIVLMKNADNLMQAVLNTLKAAESACVKGLRAVSDGSKDEEEARALATQWRLKLDQHRQLEASYREVDALGLRRLPRNVSAPSLSQILAQR